MIRLTMPIRERGPNIDLVLKEPKYPVMWGHVVLLTPISHHFQTTDEWGDLLTTIQFSAGRLWVFVRITHNTISWQSYSHQRCPAFQPDSKYYSVMFLTLAWSRLRTKGDRAFSVRAPTLWNNLLYQKRSDSLAFRTQLYKYVFSIFSSVQEFYFCSFIRTVTGFWFYDFA